METTQSMAALLGVCIKTMERRIRTVLPGVSRTGKPTYLSEEQVTLLKDWSTHKKRKQVKNPDKLTLTEIAEELACSRPVAYHYLKQVFPECIPGGGKKVYLTSEQVERLKNHYAQRKARKRNARKKSSAIDSQKTPENQGNLTIKDLCARFGCCDDSIRARIKAYFPHLMVGGNKKIYLTPEQAEFLSSRIREPYTKRATPRKSVCKKPATVKPANKPLPKALEQKDLVVKPTHSEPSIAELKTIQAEEIADKAASFRKWYEQHKKNRV